MGKEKCLKDFGRVLRDKLEKIPVTDLYYGLSWASVILSCSLLVVGLINAGNLDPASKGFYAMSFILSIFASIAVQKNARDTKYITQQVNK